MVWKDAVYDAEMQNMYYTEEAHRDRIKEAVQIWSENEMIKADASISCVDENLKDMEVEQGNELKKR